MAGSGSSPSQRPEEEVGVAPQKSPEVKRGEEVGTAVEEYPKEAAKIGEKAAADMKNVARLPDAVPATMPVVSADSPKRSDDSALQEAIALSPESQALEKATEVATEAREGAEKMQEGVTSAAEALRKVENNLTISPEERDKLRGELFKAQKDLLTARKESTEKAEAELEAAQKEEAAAKEEEKEALQKKVEEAQRKLEEATEAEAQALDGIVSDVEQMRDQIQSNPELQQQFAQSLLDLSVRADQVSHSPNRDTTPGNPQLAESLGSGSMEAVIGAAGEIAKAQPQLPYRWGGGHGNESFNDCMEKGLDCSGLVRQSLAKAGVIPSKQAPDGSTIPTVDFRARDFQAMVKAKPLNQMNVGEFDLEQAKSEGNENKENQKLNPDEVNRGSLMFWRSPATHVAIVLSPPQGGMVQIVDSSGGRGPKIRRVSIKDHHSFGNLPNVNS